MVIGRSRTNRWTGAAVACFASNLVPRRLNEIAPPGQLRRYAANVVMLKRHVFLFCFLISLFPFVAINVAAFIVTSRCCEGDSYMESGFPLYWYTEGGFVEHPRFLWNALAADVIIAVGASLISAKILKSVFRPNG